MTRPEKTSIFNFITTEDFRQSLEADYAEMNSCYDAKAWKAVHILAGSIIEAVLADYLHATNCRGPKNKDPLDMVLSDLIVACEQEKVLSEKSAKLSHAVRTYRNLIHPGRLVRLQETVDEYGAQVARALVHMIVGDVEKLRKNLYGYTAEQIITKVLQDSSSISIMNHLLKEMHETEKRRLLLHVLPLCYIEGNLDSVNEIGRLTECYRFILENSSDTIRTEATEEYIRVVKEETSRIVSLYDAGLFRASDLAYVSPDKAQIAVTHLLGDIKSLVAYRLPTLEGIGPFLTKSDIERFVDSLVTIMATHPLNHPTTQKAEEILSLETATERWKAPAMSADQRKDAEHFIAIAMMTKNIGKDSPLRAKLEEILEPGKIPF